ncbi:MAG: 23S rRNA (uracil(1939)-C(5))-methyltransferase RlmD [Oscillospiraceae bacterium]|jgi:23S rRNA (uracil1939-C5)-methyltransferase|nr:23S rRNA (uracil(1939)-C(5))-methyltransferase RlmD [Oscillospiraceae bacterium]
MEGNPPRKNELLTLAVENLGLDAMGVCRWGDARLAVFVPGALPGERVLARVVKVEKRHAFGRLERVLAPSPLRQAPPCPVYGRCGGCAAQHMAYQATLDYKRGQVRDCLARIGGIHIPVPPVLGMAEPWHYRNKGAFPVSGTADNPQIGFYAPRTHRVVDAPCGCMVQRPQANAVTASARAWISAHRVPPYNEDAHTGALRHIVTRTTQAGQTMAVLVTRTGALPYAEALLEALRRDVPGLVSLQHSVHAAPGNAILGDEPRVLWGSQALEDTLCGLRFRVSARSFFQVNPAQTEALYAQVLAYADLKPDELAVDAYCGAGAISLLLAGRARRVIGIECVADAVADARYNAQTNGIGNAEFLCAQAEEALPGLVAQGLRPHVVVVDPPRKGCDEALLRAVCQAAPDRVVYVSCNPATLARDAALLVSGGYRAAAVQCVDMFCWAGDVESVMLLRRNDEDTQ